MNNKSIKEVAVLGSGVMGSRIAALFAGIGVKVLLLDIPTPNTSKEDNPSLRNKLVNDHLQAALKSNPSPIYHKNDIRLIRTGNFEDNRQDIATADWIIEVVIEKLDIKKQVFTWVDEHRKPGSIVSSNTSGIPIHLMAEGRSESFRKHFLGTHFFNPPRYLKLLEIIPASETDKEVLEFVLEYGEKYLGKTTVLAKDTPAFIGNRICVFSLVSILNYAQREGLTVEEIDRLTGPIVGRPKSATFRTADVVGIDTLALVAKSLEQAFAPNEESQYFKLPDYIDAMLQTGKIGAKSGEGFYKKVKHADGQSEILSIDLNTLEYRAEQKAKFAVFEQAKSLPLHQRWSVLLADEGKAGAFYRNTLAALFAYSASRIPEIADFTYQIDDAIEAGFNWEAGPFKIWDALGLEKGIELIQNEGYTVPQWIEEMKQQAATQFYIQESGKRLFYNPQSKEFEIIPGTDAFLSIGLLESSNIVWKNAGTTLYDIGDGILNLEFHTKMNSIGGEVLQGIQTAITIAEERYKGLVIYNEGENFSAGANVGLILMMAAEQEFDELDLAIRQFQNTMMRLRYSSIPVVAAPHNMTLGGGCELCMHSDMVVAHSELYMGLVEFGVGLIPGGGGTKEFALRLSDELIEDDIRLNRFRRRFLTIGQAKVSTSAQEAFELGYLIKHRDIVVQSRRRQLAEAKRQALNLWERGYTQPVQRNDIYVLGKEALGLAYLGANSMKTGNYISEHDELISQKLAYVMSGGDLSQPTSVSEQYLLDLERKAFLELCMQRKTLERMQSMLTQGKILRN